MMNDLEKLVSSSVLPAIKNKKTQADGRYSNAGLLKIDEVLSDIDDSIIEQELDHLEVIDILQDDEDGRIDGDLETGFLGEAKKLQRVYGRGSGEKMSRVGHKEEKG